MQKKYLFCWIICLSKSQTSSYTRCISIFNEVASKASLWGPKSSAVGTRHGSRTYGAVSTTITTPIHITVAQILRRRKKRTPKRVCNAIILNSCYLSRSEAPITEQSTGDFFTVPPRPDQSDLGRHTRPPAGLSKSRYLPSARRSKLPCG